jgi:hypothetical protein
MYDFGESGSCEDQVKIRRERTDRRTGCGGKDGFQAGQTAKARLGPPCAVTPNAGTCSTASTEARVQIALRGRNPWKHVGRPAPSHYLTILSCVAMLRNSIQVSA